MPVEPLTGRDDVPTSTEDYQEWQKNVDARHRNRLAQGWRQSLGSRVSLAGNSSGYRNVFRTNQDPPRWFARVSHRNEKYHVGVYAEKIEAARAADRQAVMLGFKAFELNFPEHYDRHVALIKAPVKAAKETAAVPDMRAAEAHPPRSATPPQQTEDLASGDLVEDFVKLPQRSGDAGANLSRPNKTGFRGVYRSSRTSFSCIVYHNTKEHLLTGFKSAEEAARAYDVKV
jgi:hypothetical protein